MESKQWSPSKWSDNSIRRKMKRIYKQAHREACLTIGPYRADLMFAELNTELKSEQSRLELKRLGIALMGDK